MGGKGNQNHDGTHIYAKAFSPISTVNSCFPLYLLLALSCPLLSAHPFYVKELHTNKKR